MFLVMHRKNNLGHWAFLIGVVLALIAGFVPQLQTHRVAWIIALLGLLVGLLNITKQEAYQFLLATVALLLSVASAIEIFQLGSIVGVLENVVIFVFPAAFVVAFKTIWQLAKE